MLVHLVLDPIKLKFEVSVVLQVTKVSNSQPEIHSLRECC